MTGLKATPSKLGDATVLVRGAATGRALAIGAAATGAATRVAYATGAATWKNPTEIIIALQSCGTFIENVA